MKEPGRGLRFIVDAMLGNIVSWLRILGYDSIYWNGDDGDLIKKAEEENRIILTMDRGVAASAHRLGIKAMLIAKNETPKVLAELRKKYGVNLEFDPEETRCPVCNNLLTITSLHPRKMWLCPRCGKQYWIGGHWKNIVKILEEAKSVEV